MISPTTEYALRAIVAIARHGDEAVVTSAIAKTTQVPPGYLPKVLQTLSKAGLVTSRRGKGGGFTLAQRPEEITVLDIVNAVGPIKRIAHCPLGLKKHGVSLCPLHKRLDDAMELVEQAYAATTIAELLSQPGQNVPLCDLGS